MIQWVWSHILVLLLRLFTQSPISPKVLIPLSAPIASDLVVVMNNDDKVSAAVKQFKRE